MLSCLIVRLKTISRGFSIRDLLYSFLDLPVVVLSLPNSHVMMSNNEDLMDRVYSPLD
jgi:hypothetical protein